MPRSSAFLRVLCGSPCLAFDFTAEDAEGAEDRRGRSANSNSLTSSRLRAFTLVELLVALSVMLILATLTFRMVGSVLDSDRIKTGSRELQSFLAGARDRAIYAGQPRGVRFIADQTDLYSIRSFAYIGAPTNYTDGSLLAIDSTTGNITGPVAISGPTGTWTSLQSRGLLVSGTPIQLTSPTTGLVNAYLTVSPNTASATGFSITSTIAGTLPASATYTLTLAPSLLPGEEPRTLPDRIVVDLRTSVVPASWPAPTAGSQFDLLFSPDGRIYGPPASDGRIHFVLADTADTTGTVATANLNSHLQLNAPWRPSVTYLPGNVVVPVPSSGIAFRCVPPTPSTGGTSAGTAPAWPADPNAPAFVDGAVTWQAFAKKSNLIVSLATATGRVTTHPVDMSTTLVPAGTGYDTFRFAELGEVTQ